MEITQDIANFFPAKFAAQSFTDAYGYWRPAGGDRMTAMPLFMQNASNFGSDGVVYVPDGITIGSSSTCSTLQSNARILHANNNYYTPSGTLATLLNSWNSNDNDKYIAVVSGYDFYGNSSLNPFKYFPTVIGYDFIQPSVQNIYDKMLTSAPAGSRTTKLWKYLVSGEGPFGSVNINNVKLHGDAAYNGISMSGLPSTFIPLIMNSTDNSGGYDSNVCILGIDPTNRLILVGDTEIFWRYGPYNTDFDNQSSDSSKFLNNLIAYMANAALYGDLFNNQFKETISPTRR